MSGILRDSVPLTKRHRSRGNIAPPAEPRFPTTRYQGSKQRLIDLLEPVFASLPSDSVCDVFGGTGAVSFLAKRLGKTVHFNDRLSSNQIAARALIANRGALVSPERARAVFERREGMRYDALIERRFAGVFFLDHENRFLDTVAQNLARLRADWSEAEHALLFYALCQACLMKRPFNLFHRKNLALRTAEVERSFGNKTTWERPFEELVLSALEEANRAVFDNGRVHRVSGDDAETVSLDADLVYLDPPYKKRGGSVFNYGDGYHFLEGLADYHRWEGRIDARRKHLPMRLEPNDFEDRARAPAALLRLLARIPARAHVVMSYRDDGEPSVDELAAALGAHGRRVSIERRELSYALAKGRSREVVIVARARSKV